MAEIAAARDAEVTSAREVAQREAAAVRMQSHIRGSNARKEVGYGIHSHTATTNAQPTVVEAKQLARGPDGGGGLRMRAGQLGLHKPSCAPQLVPPSPQPAPLPLWSSRSPR